MWHRRDVREGRLVAEKLYGPDDLFEPAEDRQPLPLPAAWVGKVGYRFVDEPREPVVEDISAHWDQVNLTARSMTGQLCWNAGDGVVTIDTAGTQAVIGFLDEGPHELKVVTFESTAPFGALYVTSLDDAKPVDKSERLLVSAVGQARNTGMEYEVTDKVQTVMGAPLYALKEEGEAPILLRALTGELTIRSRYAGALKAWALDLNGRRREEVPLEAADGAVALRLASEHQTVYYELAVE
jgi:hypothetical protein